MKRIKIDSTLKETLPAFCLAALSFDMDVAESEMLLKQDMLQLGQDIEATVTLEQLLKLPKIAAARDAYRTLGKDPSRYRVATESLMRRLIKGNGLYEVNNAVDVGNILSVKTNRSVAVLDADKIEGDVFIRIAKDEPYEGIGRGSINIEKIPVYCDDKGPFGSPTSDTLRTAITLETKRVLLFIISFTGDADLAIDIEMAIQLFTAYCNAQQFEVAMI